MKTYFKAAQEYKLGESTQHKTFHDKDGNMGRAITEGYRKVIADGKSIGYNSVKRNTSFCSTFRGSTGAGRLRTGSINAETPGKVYQFNTNSPSRKTPNIVGRLNLSAITEQRNDVYIRAGTSGTVVSSLPERGMIMSQNSTKGNKNIVKISPT